MNPIERLKAMSQNNCTMANSDSNTKVCKPYQYDISKEYLMSGFKDISEVYSSKEEKYHKYVIGLDNDSDVIDLSSLKENSVITIFSYKPKVIVVGNGTSCLIIEGIANSNMEFDISNFGAVISTVLNANFSISDCKNVNLKHVSNITATNCMLDVLDCKDISIDNSILYICGIYKNINANKSFVIEQCEEPDEFRNVNSSKSCIVVCGSDSDISIKSDGTVFEENYSSYFKDLIDYYNFDFSTYFKNAIYFDNTLNGFREDRIYVKEHAGILSSLFVCPIRIESHDCNSYEQGTAFDDKRVFGQLFDYVMKSSTSRNEDGRLNYKSFVDIAGVILPLIDDLSLSDDGIDYTSYKFTEQYIVDILGDSYKKYFRNIVYNIQDEYYMPVKVSQRLLRM